MASLPRCDPNRLRCVLTPQRPPPRRAGRIPITLVSVGSLPVVTLLIIAAVVMAGLGYSSGLREAVRRGFDRAFCPNLTVYAGLGELNMRAFAIAAMITSLAVPAFAQQDPKAEANKAEEQKKKQGEEIDKAYKDAVKRTTTRGEICASNASRLSWRGLPSPTQTRLPLLLGPCDPCNGRLVPGGLMPRVMPRVGFALKAARPSRG